MSSTRSEASYNLTPHHSPYLSLFGCLSVDFGKGGKGASLQDLEKNSGCKIHETVTVTSELSFRLTQWLEMASDDPWSHLKCYWAASPKLLEEMSSQMSPKLPLSRKLKSKRRGDYTSSEWRILFPLSLQFYSPFRAGNHGIFFFGVLETRNLNKQMAWWVPSTLQHMISLWVRQMCFLKGGIWEYRRWQFVTSLESLGIFSRQKPLLKYLVTNSETKWQANKQRKVRTSQQILDFAKLTWKLFSKRSHHHWKS